MRDQTATEQPVASLLWEPLLYPITFAAALILRIVQSTLFVAEGELAWTHRCLSFWQALANGGLRSVPGGPGGTIAAWIGSLGFALQRSTEGVAALGVLDPADVTQLRLLASAWPLTKLPIAVAVALLTTLVAFLTARVWGARAGLLAGLLLALAPYPLAISRTLGGEALTAILTAGALLALLWGLGDVRRWLPFVISGLLGGLAFLNQNLVLLLVAYGLFLVVIAHLLPDRLAGRGGDKSPATSLIRRRALLGLRNTVLWLAALLLAVFLAYPATWASPSAAALALLDYARQSLPDVQPLARMLARLDLVDVALRLTPLSLLGVGLALLGLLGGDRVRRLTSLALLGFAALFLLLAPRPEPAGHWELTVAVVLEVAAAVGLDDLPLALRRALRPRWPKFALWPELVLSLALVAAVGWQALAVIRYHPYYSLYRNPWLLARVPPRPLIGTGEGMDRVITYLNTQPGAAQTYVATPDLARLAPFFSGHTLRLTDETLLTADLIVLYNRDWLQPTALIAGLTKATPIETVTLQGNEYARIYASRRDEPVLAALQGQVRPDDVILLDAPSPFARHYQGQAPFREIAAETSEQVAAELAKLVSGRWRLWHVSFEGADPHSIVRDLLEVHATVEKRQPVTGAVITTYLLPLAPQFSPHFRSQEEGLRFSGGLSLDRAGLAEAQVQYRQKIGLTLDWRATAKIAGNVAISLRLVDERGDIWAKQDQWVIDGQGRSTALWPSGPTVTSRYTLDLPPGIPPGPYRLRMVLYLADSLQPIPPLLPGGALGAVENELFPIEVRAAQLPPTPAELKLPRPLQATLADGVELLGCDIGAETVQAGQDLPLRLWWRTTRPVTATYQAHLILLDSKGDQRGDALVELASARHPTTTWIAGEVAEGRYRLNVGAGAAAGQALLGVELVGSKGPVAKPVPLGQVRIVAVEHAFEVPSLKNPRQETLGEAVRLLGYDLDAGTARPGQTVRLTLYWQALAPMKGRYTVFTHLLDGQGQIRAAHDGEPVDGARPTSGWVLHEVLSDRHELTVPADAQPGRYTIEVGLYLPDSGQRLPAFDSSGSELELDRILLGTVEVK